MNEINLPDSMITWDIMKIEDHVIKSLTELLRTNVYKTNLYKVDQNIDISKLNGTNHLLGLVFEVTKRYNENKILILEIHPENTCFNEVKVYPFKKTEKYLDEIVPIIVKDINNVITEFTKKLNEITIKEKILNRNNKLFPG